MPYLSPNGSRTVTLDVPQNAQACRLLMYYEHGPLWSLINGYLRAHNLYFRLG
jgi:hypothetical protein